MKDCYWELGWANTHNLKQDPFPGAQSGLCMITDLGFFGGAMKHMETLMRAIKKDYAPLSS